MKLLLFSCIWPPVPLLSKVNVQPNDQWQQTLTVESSRCFMLHRTHCQGVRQQCQVDCSRQTRGNQKQAWSCVGWLGHGYPSSFVQVIHCMLGMKPKVLMQFTSSALTLKCVARLFVSPWRWSPPETSKRLCSSSKRSCPRLRMMPMKRYSCMNAIETRSLYLPQLRRILNIANCWFNPSTLALSNSQKSPPTLFMSSWSSWAIPTTQQLSM